MTHAVLEIVKGIARVPQDNLLSSEVGLDSISLVDPNGFAVTEYEMVYPGLKSGAIFADSPLTDGRMLVSGAFGNVKETILLELNAGTILQMAAMLSKLGRMVQNCNNFWDAMVQIEPVYLKHQIAGEPGPRFALLYNIDVAIVTPIEPGTANRRVTLSIEREPYWRGIAPGDNPKHWTYLSRGDDKLWVNGHTNLITGSDHLATDTIQNRAEQNSSASGYIAENFMDIPAALIPGDAPALCQISVTQLVSVTATTILMAKSSKPISGNISRTTGNNQLTVYNFNAADANALTDTTIAADTGSPKSQAGVNNRSQTAFVTTTMTQRLNWQVSSTIPNGFSTAVFRGRFMAFLRTRLSAAGNVSLQLRIRHGSDVITTTPVVLTDTGVGGTGNTTDWALSYLGIIGFPENNKKAPVAVDGLGLLVHTGNIELQMFLDAARNSGTPVLYVADLIFIPIDEGVVRIASTNAVGTGATVATAWLYDNTGYFTHGTPDDYGTVASYVLATGVNTELDIPEVSGSAIQLTPGINNRLWFLAYVDSTKRSFITDPSAMNVRVNIVPRWMGIRDE